MCIYFCVVPLIHFQCELLLLLATTVACGYEHTVNNLISHMYCIDSLQRLNIWMVWVDLRRYCLLKIYCKFQKCFQEEAQFFTKLNVYAFIKSQIKSSEIILCMGRWFYFHANRNFCILYKDQWRLFRNLHLSLKVDNLTSKTNGYTRSQITWIRLAKTCIFATKNMTTYL